MKWQYSNKKSGGVKPLLIMLAVIAGCLLNFISCRKPDFVPQDKNAPAKAQSMTLPMQIDMHDVYDALPQSILYNLGDSATFYVGQSTYSYTDSYLVVHIPTTQDGLNYIYAAKYAGDPERTLVYAVRFLPDDGEATGGFSGTMEWLNFQNGKASGIKYTKGIPQAYTSPALVVEPGWEQCMMDQHQFAIDDNGRLIAVDGTVPNNSITGLNVATITGGGPLDCPKWGPSLGDKIGDFFSGLGNLLGGIFQDGGGAGGAGGGWPGGIFGFPGGIWLPWPNSPGGGGGGPTHPPGNDPPGSDDDANPIVFAPALSGIPGGVRYSIDDEGHGPNPGNPVVVYDGEVVGSASDVHLGGNKDANGFYYSRIMALQVYLQAHPYGMIDCGDLGNLPSEVHQEVGNYQIPQSVTNRIESIRNTYSPQYNQNNFYIQKLENAHGGVVNCDYFPVHISQLPKNSNNQTMTPLEYLEYFRQNIDYITGLGGGGGFAGTNFESYYDNNVNFFDSKFTENLGSSLGALVHIIIGPVQDNGTIVESGYQTTSSSSQYWFMFTTMYSPVDAAHPVAGNRRFGIKPDPNGGYTLYIMGVDRTNDWSTTILNVTTGIAFSSADALWNAVQDGVISDVNSNGGQASLYTPRQQYARPKWNKVKEFLKGQITLQELKNELNCP